MNRLKLISEDIFDVQVITEGEEKKDLFIEGVFMQAEKRNRNGRVYTLPILEAQINSFIDEKVNHNRALGELNHPPSPAVNPERASHLITEIKRSGNDFNGKAKVLSTPIGSIVRSLIESKVSLGVSSRGLGSLKEGTGQYSGSKLVQENYRLVTVDIVADPSAPDAWVNGIFESVEYVIEQGAVKEFDAQKLLQERNRLYKEIKRPHVERVQKLGIANAIVDFIDKLSK